MKDTGSFKIRFQNGRPSKFFYRDDGPSRRLHPDMLTSETGAGAGVRLGRTGQGITFTGAFNAGLHARQPVVLHTCLLEWVKLIVMAGSNLLRHDASGTRLVCWVGLGLDFTDDFTSKVAVRR